MMKKGLVEMMIGIMVFLFLYVYIITTAVYNSSIVKQNTADNNILLDGSRVETYVRSFLQALKLSLLQSIYDTGNSYAGRNWQCYTQNCLFSSCSINSIANDLLSGASNYANLYLGAYDKFSSNSNPKVQVPSTINMPVLWSINNDGVNSYVYSKWPETSFSLKDDSINLETDRTFTPETQVSTVFRPMYDFISKLILSDWLWYSYNGNDQNGIKHAIEDSNSHVACNGYSCTSGPVSSTNHCTDYPTPGQVYSDNYGTTIGSTKDTIVSNIDGNLGSLQQSLSSSSGGIFNVQLTGRVEYVTEKSDISPVCSQDSGNSDPCKICQSCPASGVCTSYPCGTWYRTTCTYNYYGVAQTKVDVAETAYPKYALFNPNLNTQTNVGLDHLHLKNTITSGNDPSLISCNVWTR